MLVGGWWAGKLCNIQWLLWCVHVWGWMPLNSTALFAILENEYSSQMAVWQGVVARNDICGQGWVGFHWGSSSNDDGVLCSPLYPPPLWAVKHDGWPYARHSELMPVRLDSGDIILDSAGKLVVSLS